MTWAKRLYSLFLKRFDFNDSLYTSMQSSTSVRQSCALTACPRTIKTVPTIALRGMATAYRQFFIATLGLHLHDNILIFIFQFRKYNLFGYNHVSTALRHASRRLPNSLPCVQQNQGNFTTRVAELNRIYRISPFQSRNCDKHAFIGPWRSFSSRERRLARSCQRRRMPPRRVR